MNFELISFRVLVIGVMIFFGGLITLATPLNDSSTDLAKTSLTERDLAIAQAKQTGQTTYSFNTRFVPGIGQLSDPEAYKRSWQKQAEQSTN